MIHSIWTLATSLVIEVTPSAKKNLCSLRVKSNLPLNSLLAKQILDLQSTVSVLFQNELKSYLLITDSFHCTDVFGFIVPQLISTDVKDVCMQGYRRNIIRCSNTFTKTE